MGDYLKVYPVFRRIKKFYGRRFFYTHYPKVNTYIERYDRTIREEFIDNNRNIIDDKSVFSQKLADYLIFYTNLTSTLGKAIPLVDWDTYPSLGKVRYPHLQIHKRRMSNWYYNGERPHKSLNLKSPLEYLIKKGKMSQMFLTYTPP